VLKEWIKENAVPQLRDYVNSRQVREMMRSGNSVLHALIVIIVGSRHILLYDNADATFRLVHRPNERMK